MSKNRAININKFVTKKFTTLDLKGDWKNHLGTPQSTGIWLVWGNSFNGKTGYCLEMAKMLTDFERVVYDSLEEGARLSLQSAVIRTNLKSVSRRLQILDSEPFEELVERMRKPKSAHVWFIDSFQYAALTKKQYIAFKEEFGNKKLIIFISHAEGKMPEGKVAKFVRYDVDVKIWVEGYKAFPGSRHGGRNVFIISEDRAKEYWDQKKQSHESR